MSKLNLLIANAGKYFTDAEIEIFHDAARAAEKYISSKFNFDYDVDIVITNPSYLLATIPEDGISGRTYSSRLIVLAVDKQQATISEDLMFETICHEMSHSLRWEKLPEYSKTLFDSLIFEGLAVALEEEAIAKSGRPSQLYFLSEMQSTNQMVIDGIISELENNFNDEKYDYDTIFFTGNESLPRWAGYRLGYYLVKKQLEEKSATIEQLTIASYGDFILYS